MACSKCSGGKSGKGSSSGYNQLNTMNPQQSRALQQLLGSMNPAAANTQNNPLYQQGQNYLSGLLGGGEDAFKRFEAPFMRQFQEQTVPGLAERFAGLGAGAQSSSAFQQSLGQAGAGLSENLANLRSQLQFGALGPALQYSQQPFNNLATLLGIQTQAFAPQQQKQMGFGQQLLNSFVGGVGSGLKFL